MHILTRKVYSTIFAKTLQGHGHLLFPAAIHPILASEYYSWTNCAGLPWVTLAPVSTQHVQILDAVGQWFSILPTIKPLPNWQHNGQQHQETQTSPSKCNKSFTAAGKDNLFGEFILEWTHLKDSFWTPILQIPVPILDWNLTNLAKWVWYHIITQGQKKMLKNHHS